MAEMKQGSQPICGTAGSASPGGDTGHFTLCLVRTQALPLEYLQGMTLYQEHRLRILLFLFLFFTGRDWFFKTPSENQFALCSQEG